MTTPTTVPVQGMDCTGCENNIQFALTSLAGVHQVKADHLTQTVQVDYDPALITLDEIHGAVEAMGYRVAGS